MSEALVMLDLYEELKSLIAALDEHQIDYALCGGMAMAIHDRPRFTIDIDLLIEDNSLPRPLRMESGHRVSAV